MKVTCPKDMNPAIFERAQRDKAERDRIEKCHHDIARLQIKQHGVIKYSELAKALGVDSMKISHLIRDGFIRVENDRGASEAEISTATVLHLLECSTYGQDPAVLERINALFS